MTNIPGAEAVDRYLIETLTPEDEALTAAQERATAAGLPDIAMAPNQAALVALLARMVGARRILEVGTLAGYTAIHLARAVGEQGRVVTLEIDAAHAAVARENLRAAGVAERVEVVEGPARDAVTRLVEDGAEPFDLVLIDADKPSNPDYLEAALRLTRPGAVIVVDNVVRGGRVADSASQDASVVGTRRVLEMVAAEPRLEATAVQTVGIKGWDGLTVCRVVDPAA
ncbi:Putative O-methyltransferase MSMEG_5073 [Kytococcus sedentarius]|nr:O-methyltransferase [Kytococcus sedentarius]STX12116.1 Putative O-methyltransferase MSMEG_5073 [Kytococcus sedentarius]